MSDVLILGAGLIGTSIGLALRTRADGHEAGPRDVCVHDVLRRHRDEAVAAGAGRAWDGQEPAELVVIAGPPRAIAGQLSEAMRLDLGNTYTHVSSVQSRVQREVEALNVNLSRFVGGHPMAGREISGPAAALPDLFSGRRWAVCPHPASAASAIAAVEHLAVACGAEPVRSTPAAHDAAVALTSHLPHVVAVALAGLLVAPCDLALAGPGLTDMTRLAAGDPSLWREVLESNSRDVAPLVRRLAEDLLKLADSLAGLHPAGPTAVPARARAAAAVSGFLEAGRAGRARLPVKRGLQDTGFTTVVVAMRDQPGQLLAVLRVAAEADVNVEDVRVEHLPGRPTGSALLSVRAADADRFRAALAVQPHSPASPAT